MHGEWQPPFRSVRHRRKPCDLRGALQRGGLGLAGAVPVTDSLTMKLLVVDDHPVFRDGLAALLRQAAEHTVILQAAECATALRVAADHPDLDAVFVDLMMPGM